jgi:hypothetical protein
MDHYPASSYSKFTIVGIAHPTIGGVELMCWMNAPGFKTLGRQLAGKT